MDEMTRKVEKLNFRGNLPSSLQSLNFRDQYKHLFALKICSLLLVGLQFFFLLIRTKYTDVTLQQLGLIGKFFNSFESWKQLKLKMLNLKQFNTRF